MTLFYNPLSQQSQVRRVPRDFTLHAHCTPVSSSLLVRLHTINFGPTLKKLNKKNTILFLTPIWKKLKKGQVNKIDPGIYAATLKPFKFSPDSGVPSYAGTMKISTSYTFSSQSNHSSEGHLCICNNFLQHFHRFFCD